jgi:hypothetical protein
MPIELPDKVVSLLQFIGINWPKLVREFAGHVRYFASKVEATQQDSTVTIHKMADFYQSASYEALLARWGQMPSGHTAELARACRAVATVLDVAPDPSVGTKGAAIAELVSLAVMFVADQGAAVATLGKAAETLIVEAAKKCVNLLEPEARAELIHSHAQKIGLQAGKFKAKAPAVSFV